MSWQRVDTTDPAAVAAASTIAHALCATHPDATLYHDIDDLLARDHAHLQIHVYERNGVRGYLPLRVQSRPLPIRIGEVTLARFPLTSLIMPRGPIVETNGADLRGVLEEMLDTLLPVLDGRTALHIEGIPLESELHRLLVALAGAGERIRIVPLSAPFEHQYIRMEGSFEGYLRQMSKRSRKSVQYSQRKLRKEVEGVRMECAARPEDVPAFVDAAVSVSRRTYQWHLLGLGLRDPESLRGLLTRSAGLGRLRSYILYCQDEPVAFMLGHIYNGVYYYIDVGYDQQWKDWSVGSVLQLEVLEDLYAMDTPPKLFDFSTGYGAHKGRFGNRSTLETNLLVLPRTPRTLFMGRAYAASEGLSRWGSRVLDDLGVKDRMKRFIRRRSVQ